MSNGESQKAIRADDGGRKAEVRGRRAEDGGERRYHSPVKIKSFPAREQIDEILSDCPGPDGSSSEDAHRHPCPG